MRETRSQLIERERARLNGIHATVRIASRRFSMMPADLDSASSSPCRISCASRRHHRAERRQREKMTRAFGHASGSFFPPAPSVLPPPPSLSLSLRRASFGDCTHMTAYFVVPTGADIIYTAEYRPGEREILACRKIFFRATNARASGEKIPPLGLPPRYINASGVRSSSLLCV